MPNTGHGPLEEPGKRTGEGSQSILPHLQRQVQTQIKPPAKKPRPPDADGPETEPSDQQ